MGECPPGQRARSLVMLSVPCMLSVSVEGTAEMQPGSPKNTASTPKD